MGSAHDCCSPDLHLQLVSAIEERDAIDVSSGCLAKQVLMLCVCMFVCV